MAADGVVAENKDWIWALDHPCLECGLDVSQIPGERLSLRLRASLPRWCTVLMGPRARDRPTPTTWSPLECAAHLSDVCSIVIGRIELMLLHDDPLFATWDQDLAAGNGRYESLEPGVVAIELDAAGRAVADRFDGLTPEQLGRRGRRSDGKEFTVLTLGRYFVHDVEHHLYEVGA